MHMATFRGFIAGDIPDRHQETTATATLDARRAMRERSEASSDSRKRSLSTSAIVHRLY
jgi:hypothetical protein